MAVQMTHDARFPEANFQGEELTPEQKNYMFELHARFKDHPLLIHNFNLLVDKWKFRHLDGPYSPLDFIQGAVPLLKTDLGWIERLTVFVGSKYAIHCQPCATSQNPSQERADDSPSGIVSIIMPNGTQMYSTNYVTTPISWHYGYLQAVSELQLDADGEPTTKRRRLPGQGFRSDLVLGGRLDLVKNTEERREAAEMDSLIAQRQAPKQQQQQQCSLPRPQLQVQTMDSTPTSMVTRFSITANTFPPTRRSRAPGPEESVTTPECAKPFSVAASANPAHLFSESQSTVTTTSKNDDALDDMQVDNASNKTTTPIPVWHADPRKVFQERQIEVGPQLQQQQMEGSDNSSSEYFSDSRTQSQSSPRDNVTSTSLNFNLPFSSGTQRPLLPMGTRSSLFETRTLPLPIASFARCAEVPRPTDNFMNLARPSSRNNYEHQLEGSLVSPEPQVSSHAQAHSVRHRFNFPPTVSTASAELEAYSVSSGYHSRYTWPCPTRPDSLAQSATSYNKRHVSEDNDDHSAEPPPAARRLSDSHLNLTPHRDYGASLNINQPSFPDTRGPTDVNSTAHAVQGIHYPYPRPDLYPYQNYFQDTVGQRYPSPALSITPKAHMTSSSGCAGERGRPSERGPRYSYDIDSRYTNTDYCRLRQAYFPQAQRRRTASPRRTPRPPQPSTNSDPQQSLQAFVQSMKHYCTKINEPRIYKAFKAIIDVYEGSKTKDLPNGNELACIEDMSYLFMDYPTFMRELGRCFSTAYNIECGYGWVKVRTPTGETFHTSKDGHERPWKFTPVRSVPPVHAPKIVANVVDENPGLLSEHS